MLIPGMPGSMLIPGILGSMLGFATGVPVGVGEAAGDWHAATASARAIGTMKVVRRTNTGAVSSGGGDGEAGGRPVL
jgi:hypothetical protein